MRSFKNDIYRAFFEIDGIEYLLENPFNFESATPINIKHKPEKGQNFHTKKITTDIICSHFIGSDNHPYIRY